MREIDRVDDYLFGFVELPLSLTENNDLKLVRVVGILVFMLWFFPAMLCVIIFGPLLGIFAMILDA